MDERLADSSREGITLRRAERDAALRAEREARRKRRSDVTWVEKKYSDAELLAVLEEANSEIGGILTSTAYGDFARGRSFADGRPWPTHQTHLNRFGSWRQALLAAGLAANPSSAIAGQRLFDESHCIDAVRHACREVGALPSVNEYEAIARASDGALPSVATVRKRCGSWRQALRKADLI